ncbi:MAG: hypothetical protein LBG60_07560 [Bifidobacteriaceae bacterium]|jgi:uncharacterized protein (DUF433 family)|nr:hypothetical protein [Bifidobacteriaceae bacterium]
MYSHADADRVLRLPAGTARRWLNGYRRKGRLYEPVLRERAIDSDIVTWGELVETRLLDEYRRKGAPIQRLRPAILKLRAEFGPYPLAHAHPLLDVEGRELVWRVQDELGLPPRLRLVVAGSGRGLVCAPAARRFVEAAEYNAEREVARLYPQVGSKIVMIDPDYAQGQPAVRATPAEALREQWEAGQSIAEIADLWEMEFGEVEAAVRYRTKAA